MKKLKVVLSSILVAAALCAGVTAIGCNKKTDEDEHIHTYAGSWSYSQEKHWKGATCEHTAERSEVADHDFGSDNVCKVCGYKLVKGGIVVSKTTTQYVLDQSAGKTTANIATDDITVKKVDENGTETALSSSEYTLEYYSGDAKIDNLNGLSNGAYNIWAKAEIDGAVKEAFVVAYVIDNVVDFKRADTLTSEARTQDLGLDVISDKWNFVVEYASGRTKTVNVNDENVVRTNFSTFLERKNAQSTVTYTESNIIGEVTTKSATVTYTINKNPESNIIYNSYSFDAFNTSWANQDKVALKQEDFVEDNAFLTLIGGTAQYRGNSNKVLEIRGDVLSIEFTGVGLVQLQARSTSNSSYSSVAIVDEDGNYIPATYSNSSNVRADDDYNYYAVTGDGVMLEFAIPKAGTYKIVTVDEVIFNGDAISTARFTRILSLSTTDIPTTEGAN